MRNVNDLWEKFGFGDKMGLTDTKIKEDSAERI